MAILRTVDEKKIEPVWVDARRNVSSEEDPD
jgi:hypothetical protein